jgi:hypothetical protein
VGDHLDLDPAGNETDDAAAADPITRQLHEAARRHAATFLPFAVRLANTPGWIGIDDAARWLREELAPATNELPARLGLIYDAVLVLAEFLDQDNRLRHKPDASADPLEPETRRALETLIRIAAPWVRHFPTARAIDDAPGAFLARPNLLLPASDFLSAAARETLIPEATRDHLAILAKAVAHGDFQRRKAQNRFIGTAKNLIGKAFSLLVAFEVGMAGNLAYKDSLIAPKLARALLSGEHAIMRIAEEASTDVHAAYADILDRLKKGQPLIDPTPDPAILPAQPPNPPPNFDLKEVHRRILQREPVPPDWRPFVTRLDFSRDSVFRPANAGDKWARSLADLTPVAGLTNLQAIRLDTTLVSDLAPLAGLVNLQTLDLDNTEVSDLTPLARLANLRRLYLDNTYVSDIAPLAGLANLQVLWLDRTEVNDVALLANLTNLDTLGLQNTQAIDASMLGHVPNLHLPAGAKPHQAAAARDDRAAPSPAAFSRYAAKDPRGVLPRLPADRAAHPDDTPLASANYPSSRPPINSTTRCTCTDIKIPNPIIAMINADPPCEISGSGKVSRGGAGAT